MNFREYKLGHRNRGEVVEVTLSGSAANVRLMDSTNLRNYKAGKAHRYNGGGLVKKSPFRMVIPRSGNWFVTVDLNGLSSRSVKSGVRILPGALPAARSHNALSDSFPTLSPLVHEPIGTAVVDGQIVSAPVYDVFISHASEDKAEVARPLANALREAGLDVWYDEFTLKMGSNLRTSIDQGILNSRFGVVVLSPMFFSKGWPSHELDGLVTQKNGGSQQILPIWHNLSKSEVAMHSPSLANTIARSTANFSIEQIAEEIAEVVVTATSSEADSDHFAPEE